MSVRSALLGLYPAREGNRVPWRIGAVAALILAALVLPPAHPTLALGGVALVLIGSAAVGGAAGGPPGQGEHR